MYSDGTEEFPQRDLYELNRFSLFHLVISLSDQRNSLFNHLKLYMSLLPMRVLCRSCDSRSALFVHGVFAQHLKKFDGLELSF